jgi:hypothetical protein
MPTFEFTLIFDVSGGCPDPDECVEALGSHGCDDAIVGLGKPGRIALTFDRRSASAWESMTGALRDVKAAIPGARLLEAAPDFVGVTDIADRVGRSRQNMRQLMLASGSAAPAPVHEGAASIWHLADVLTWLRDAKAYRVDGDLLALATAAKQVNLLVARRDLDRAAERDLAALV